MVQRQTSLLRRPYVDRHAIQDVNADPSNLRAVHPNFAFNGTDRDGNPAHAVFGLSTPNLGDDLQALAVATISPHVSTLIDRARFGAVVDFVDVHFRGYHWPAFNVADSAITIGVAMLALAALADRSPSTPA